MKTNESKEEEWNLKAARLKILLDASYELVSHNYEQCREYLFVFMDTIPVSSVASTELHDVYKSLEEVFNEGIDEIQHNILGIYGRGFEQDNDPLHGLPVGDYQEEETFKLQRYFSRSFHSKCWSVSHEHELIPSK